jgi:hypothetical protein
MTTGEQVMPLRPHEYANYGLFLKRLILGVISLPINVVGATPLPDGLPAVQEHLIASKDTMRIRDAPLVRVEESSSSSANLPPEVTQRNDEIRTVQFMPRPDSPEGPLSGLMGRPALPFPPRDPGFGPAPGFSPKTACLEDINRQMAIYGYTKSKLQLTDSQKTAWKAIDEALDSLNGKLRASCETSPNAVVGSPGIIERSDFLEKRLAARLDLVRALKAPVQRLLGQLTPDQRAVLDAPPPFPPL